jgi:GNAT superfamily N-acetyltransferase
MNNSDDIFISNDKGTLDVEAINKFLVNESYWAVNRTIEQTRTAIENSICFGVYYRKEMIGFARVVSDRATFAYIGDVFIRSEYRGKGISKRLMEAILSHKDLQGLRRWVLATRDAHGLYAQFGFTELKHPERWMELAAPGAY